MRQVLVLAAALCCAFPALVDSPRVSHDPRELGRVILRELSVREGQLVIRTDSNGCTQKSSFRIEKRKEAGFSADVPTYRLSIERTVVDDCKALVWDGVQIEFDLAKDLGLSGAFTVAIDNPVIATPAKAAFSSPAAKEVSDLRAPLHFDLCLAYKRQHFSFIPDYYVYVTDMR